MSGGVPGVGKLPPMPIVNVNTRNPAGFTSVKVEPPKEAATKSPSMISASNGPPDDDKKSTIYLIA